jgi:di/tricarboxylate transporter
MITANRRAKATIAFFSPIGHQCNTLVMGPGGYRFGDYWRLDEIGTDPARNDH